MAICNRDLDASQQLETIGGAFSATATGATLFLRAFPTQGALAALVCQASGLSGTPVYSVELHRFIVGAGLTVIATGLNVTVAAAFGTSGTYSASISESATLAQVLPGDRIAIKSSGANTAATDLVVSVVIRAVQDIKSTWGLQA